MPIFLLYASLVLLILLGIFLGLVVLATSRMKEQNRRAVGGIAVALAAVGAAFYCYLVVLLLEAHFDTKDFWSSSEEAQLRKYTEACEGPLALGTSVADVHAWLADRGILAAEDPQRDRGERVFFRERIDEASRTHAIDIKDGNVRNWNPGGDTNVTVGIRFDGGRVSRCDVRINRYGR